MRLILRTISMRWLDRLTKKAVNEPSVEERMAAAYEAAGRGDYQTALDIWAPLAQAGVARAQNNIGACFSEGLGVERDHSLALRWLTSAAEEGDPVGRRNLAALYFRGEGVGQDQKRAAELYRAAAEAGDAPAQDMLSWLLLEEASVSFDPVEARRWALAAAEQGIASPRPAAMPMVRQCSAPRTSSALACRATALRPWHGSSGHTPATARLPRNSSRALAAH
jgi:TPR repeat protein